MDDVKHCPDTRALNILSTKMILCIEHNTTQHNTTTHFLNNFPHKYCLIFC